MKRLLLVLFLMLFPFILFSQIQNNNSEEPESSHKIRISLLIPGISVETGIYKQISLFTEIGTGYSLMISEKGNQFFMNIMYSPNELPNSRKYSKFFPFAKIEERFYYNTDKRIAAGKSVKNFTGNYISNYNVYILNEMFTTGFTWGLQRNSRKFYFNLNLGIGISFENKDIMPAFITDVKLGIRLN